MSDIVMSWGYYYVIMLLCSAVLLSVLITIALADINTCIIKTLIRVTEDRVYRVSCKLYRDQMIAELTMRASLAKSEEERDKVFDDMRQYRDTYIVNRRRL